MNMYNNPLNFADGGWVDHRYGPPGTDTIPAVADGLPLQLDGGEFVMPEDTTAMIGPDNLQAIVDATHQKKRKMADGGWLAQVLGGKFDRAAQIDNVVNSAAGAPPPPPPAPAPPPPQPDRSAQMVKDFMADIRARQYADGGMVPGYEDGGWLSKLMNRTAQIDQAVDSAVAPPPQPAVPPPAPVPPTYVDNSAQMLRDFMSDIRSREYADGGEVPKKKSADPFNALMYLRAAGLV